MSKGVTGMLRGGPRRNQYNPERISTRNPHIRALRIQVRSRPLSSSSPSDIVIMDAIKSLLSPLTMGTGAIQDTLVSSYPTNVYLSSSHHYPSPQKLVVIGGTVETARRASMSAWNGFVDCEYNLKWLTWALTNRYVCQRSS